MGEIDKKLDELIDLVVKEKDYSSGTVLYALKGAKCIPHHHRVFALEVCRLVKDKMRPMLEAEKASWN